MLMMTMTLWWQLIVSTKRCVWNVANQGWTGWEEEVCCFVMKYNGLCWDTTTLTYYDFWLPSFSNLTIHIEALAFEENSLWSSETFSHWSQDIVLCCSRLMQPPSLLFFLLMILLRSCFMFFWLDVTPSLLILLLIIVVVSSVISTFSFTAQQFLLISTFFICSRATAAESFIPQGHLQSHAGSGV